MVSGTYTRYPGGRIEHLVIIDGHHLMYRAYWAIPRTLKTSSGELVNIAFGMASMLISILKQEEPDSLLVCFDAGEQTFRHAENATYKEGRAETPDDFYPQLPRVNELVAAFAFPVVSDGNYEADDFLCTYAVAAEKAGMRVTIVTGDKDALQLATDKIRISIPHKGYQAAEYLGPAEIVAKYGIRPDQVAAYKGLIGDSSDNLPGVKGIGPKTASELLQKYDTLEGIYEHLSEIRPTVKAKLEADRDAAFFCQRMARLVCVDPLPLPLDALRLQHLKQEPFLALCQILEFTLLLKRFQSMTESPYGKRVFDPAVALPKTPSAKADDASQLALF